MGKTDLVKFSVNHFLDLGSNLVTHKILVFVRAGGGERGGGRLVRSQDLVCFDSIAAEMQIICGGLRFINIVICYQTRHETSETNLKNVPTPDLKKFPFFSLHLFDLQNLPRPRI